MRAPLPITATYLERILVPSGSDLTVRAQGPSGPPVQASIQTSSTPPYEISVPVRVDAAAYPMTVTATLTSTIGHVLSGSVTLAEKLAGAVEIVMRTRAQ